MRLAGTYHPIPYLLERLSQYLPGIVEKSALWLDYDRELYSTNDSAPIYNELKVRAQTIRNTTATHEWDNHSGLFTNVNNHKKQLSFKDEDELNVLRIYLSSPIDQMKDMISITFSPNVFLKSLNIEFKGISTQEKHILSSILCSILQAEHTKVVEERNLLMQVERINKQRTTQIKQLKEHLKSTEQLYSSAIENILSDFVSIYERELNKVFTISRKVVYKLSKERLSLSHIEKVMKEAIFLAYNLNFNDKTIVVTEDHIQLGGLPIRTHNVSSNAQESNKVKNLLDRYEEAALRLIQNNEVVNNKNLASYLTPPITPPAISDAVKKNNNKIIYLLQQYPEKWVNIRSDIRSIAKLDQSSSSTSLAV